MTGITRVGSPGGVPLDVVASEKLSRELAPSPGDPPVEMGVCPECALLILLTEDRESNKKSSIFLTDVREVRGKIPDPFDRGPTNVGGNSQILFTED